MTEKLTAGCLYGASEFSVIEEFKESYQCHCKQYQKHTGRGFAPNIINLQENSQSHSAHSVGQHCPSSTKPEHH